MCEQQLQFHRRKISSRTSVAARSEIHVDPVSVSEILLVAPLWTPTQFEVPEPVEGIRIRCHLRIKQYTPGSDTEMRSSWDLGTRRQGQCRKHTTIEGY